MTPDEFREMALRLPTVEERSHMGHPDFRVGGKIFATLGYPDASCGMAALSPAEQQEFMRIDPAFYPAPGKWGDQGATLIRLNNADDSNVSNAIGAAWRRKAPKKLH